MVEWLHTQFGFSVVLMSVVVSAMLTAAGYCTLLERKVAAWVQDRIGPNRAGPRGLLQPLADGVKFLFKEESLPEGVDKPLFILAPMIAFSVAMVGFAVIPWGGEYQPAGLAHAIRIQVASVDIGLLYILAVGAMSVYGVVLGGWASNNKYSFYGGLRAAAQMLSYEVPMGLGILVVVLTVGELRLENIVAAQVGGWWNLFLHPITLVVLVTTALAETNRAPFDLAECEQELVGGFHTEYSAMKWAMFFLGEYTHMLTAGALLTALFLGGWHLPGIGLRQSSIAGVLVQFCISWLKIGGFIFLFMLIRWTLPRFRFDQLMRLCWKGLVPVMLGIVASTVLLLYAGLQQTIWAPLSELGVVAIAGLVHAARAGRVSGRQESFERSGRATTSRMAALQP